MKINRSRNAYRAFLSERGSIEAGLTIIPTTAFFLLTLQLVISGSYQVVETMKLQSMVTKFALGDKSEGEQQAYLNRTLNYKYQSMPGGGELILANSEISSPRVSNLITQKPLMKAEAIAISE